jgi:hypothetical protein
MSELKGDCDSLSAISDAPSAEDCGTVLAGARVHEVSCVHRGETYFGHLMLWKVIQLYGTEHDRTVKNSTSMNIAR